MKANIIAMVLASFGSSCNSPEQNVTDPPNIVIVLADDLGYGDPGVYNPDSKIPTPHIDQLAKEGMRFTDAHTPSSVCTPTRYGLLTGRYAWRTALKSSVLWAWDKPLIKKNRHTLPKMLKKKGYATACIGKWHLGWQWPSNLDKGFVNDSIKIGNYGLKGRHQLWKKIDFSKPLGGGPLAVGFDYYFGDDVPNFAPYTFFENQSLLQIPDTVKPDSVYGGPGPMAKGWQLENVMPKITTKAVHYIEEQSQKENPFFLYFALTAPHTPIAPTNDFKGKSGAGAYGDFVHEVDWSVGQVVEALKRTGQFKNTLFIFTSDNGSPQRNGERMGGPIASVKTYGHDPSKPWRGMKADIWEGGHRVPFIASWPKQIKSNKISHQLVCLTDIISSVAAILGIQPNEKAMEDSYDISPILFGTDEPVREDVIHHSIDGTFAIRKGHWKLILGKDSGGFSRGLKINGIPVQTEGQLYNLAEDPSEKTNRYADFPEKVTELTTLLNQYKNRGNSHQ
ncbi:MAG: arylsulfatase [Flavobacteriaceae bacterium]